MRQGASGRSVTDSAPEAWPSEVRASLGPHHVRRQHRARQGARRPRRRRCLLKGCEKSFRPTHPQARYCSPECRAAARRWRRRRASRQYRRTPKGRVNRQAQCRRYRCRCAERRRAARVQAVPPEGPDTPCGGDDRGREGRRPAGDAEFSCCDRPGCYEHFLPSKRSPCRRFCSPSCRQALRRVIERERRWRQRARRARWRRSASRCRGP